MPPITIKRRQIKQEVTLMAKKEFGKYCPFCGEDVSNQEETEFGIFCSNCHNDFWRSECIYDPSNCMNDLIPDKEAG
jgi:hypothetical protein